MDKYETLEQVQETIEDIRTNPKYENMEERQKNMFLKELNKLKKEFENKPALREGKKTDFGMLSVKAGIDKNPKPTKADRIAGAKMNAKSGARTTMRGVKIAKKGYRKAKLS